MDQTNILEALQDVGERLPRERPIEIYLIGGAAGLLTQQLAPNRTTSDCDVIHFQPQDAKQLILRAVGQVAEIRRLPPDWLNFKAMQLDILPHGWHTRCCHIETFGSLSIFAVSRIDLLAMKFYANHAQDREDIQAMQPTRKELDCVRTYLKYAARSFAPGQSGSGSVGRSVIGCD